ncbi:MAG: C-GCAxxG-C-C family protein, partial [Chlorobiales bacterium]|nr:C-GCAxxG-C-C family protein [Chlorobiales bacterium]
MNQSFQKGKETFESGFYCAESVLKVIAEEEGIDSPLVPAIATGFSSGTARTGFLCGAVAGGILSMGLVFGRSSPDQSENQTYRAVRQLLSEFG